MADESKSQKKGSITEEDAASLIERYSVETVLTLLQEVERVAGDKIEWEELVKSTATGISCAREYQMLWRHLAYGQSLEDQIDTDAEPMDDDSDLEYELEAFPAATPEESDVAAACVKVLISSGSTDSAVDALLTINTRSSKASNVSSDGSLLADAIQGTKVTIPVSVPEIVRSTPSKTRRNWSEDEDMKLTAAVQKYGEPDWDDIAKGVFDNDISASELSKRWASLQKKLHNPTAGSSSDLSETELATATIEDSVTAAAIAAGARVGTSTEASSLSKAARPQNVRLKAAAGSVMRRYRAITHRLPRKARYFRGGLAKAQARTIKPNPGGDARVLNLSSKKRNSIASIPSVEVSKHAEGAAGSTSGSGMRGLVRKDQIHSQSDAPISSLVEQVPDNQSSASGQSGYQSSNSSPDSGNHTVDAMQCSEDEEY